MDAQILGKWAQKKLVLVRTVGPFFFILLHVKCTTNGIDIDLYSFFLFAVHSARYVDIYMDK